MTHYFIRPIQYLINGACNGLTFIRRLFGRLTKPLADTLYPDGIKCVACGNELVADNKYGLCDRVECRLLHNECYCDKCGSNLGDSGDNPIGIQLCKHCKQESHPYEYVRAPLVYDAKVKDLIRSYKFGRKRYLSKFLSQHVIDCYYEHICNKVQIDYITYVPVHKSKLKARGFNQAELIAKELAETIKKDQPHASVPLLPTLDKTIQHKLDTAQKGRKARFASVSGVMQLKKATRQLS